MLHPKQQHIVDIYGKEPETLDEIAEACIAVIRHERDVPVVGFAWSIGYQRQVSNSHSSPVIGRTNWGGSDKNGPTHYPGFSGRVWIRYATRPDFGRCSDTFNASLTHTGTGGGGAYDGIWQRICREVYRTRINDPLTGRFIYKYPEPKCFSWDYKIFLDDFPGLNDVIGEKIRAHDLQEDKNEMWATVNQKYYRRKTYVHNHSFQWEDAGTKDKDEAFIREVQYLTDDVLV